MNEERLACIEVRIDNIKEKSEKLEVRVDKIDSRMSKFEAKINNRYEEKPDNLEAKINKLEERMNLLETKVDRLEDNYKKFEAKTNTKFDSLEERMNTLEERMDRIEITLNNHDEDMKSIKRSLLVIEDAVTNKIPALFDAYKVNEEKHKEFDDRITTVEDISNTNSIKISVLENTSKAHSKQLAKLTS